MADATEEAGLTLASLSDETEAHLKSVLPAFAAVSNPLDTTGAGIVEGDVRAHAEAVAVLAADPDVGLVLACQDAKNGWAQPEASSQMFLDAVTAAHQASAGAGKPLAVVSPTCGMVDARARRYMVDNGIPFLAGLGPPCRPWPRYWALPKGRGGPRARVAVAGRPPPWRAPATGGAVASMLADRLPASRRPGPRYGPIWSCTAKGTLRPEGACSAGRWP